MMNKLKQTFLILTILFGMINLSKAQEKQNDATWEETIEFIKENIENFNSSLEVRSKQITTESKFNSNIEDNKLVQVSIQSVITYPNNARESKKYSTEIRKVKLKDIVKAKFERSPGGFDLLSLYFIENSVNQEYKMQSTGKEVEGKVSSITVVGCEKAYRYSDGRIKCEGEFWNKNNESIQRILKAFKHLAYLASEKRKESKF